MFDISPSCVLKCQQCDIWRNSPETPISFEKSKILIDKIYEWLGPFYLFFTGGEPLMNPDLLKIIKYCSNLGISTHLNTNAFLINDSLAKKLIESGLTAVSISLDGASSSTHDSLRGKNGVFDQVIKAINLFKKYQELNKPKIFINTVIMNQNTNELVDLSKLVASLNCEGINFQCLLPNLGIIHEKPTVNLWPSTKKLKPILSQLKKDLSSNKKILHSPDFFDSVLKYYKNPHYLDNKPCTAGINNFIFDHNGQVKLCFEFPGVGNLYKNSAKDIWFNSVSQKQRIHIRNCKQTCKIIACNQLR
jgi:MoaA/NifB/PqqE/SkfB family radical SAM enzyme